MSPSAANAASGHYIQFLYIFFLNSSHKTHAAYMRDGDCIKHLYMCVCVSRYYTYHVHVTLEIIIVINAFVGGGFITHRLSVFNWSNETGHVAGPRDAENSEATVGIQYTVRAENGFGGYKRYRVFASPSSDFRLAPPFGGRRKSSRRRQREERLRVFICTDDRRWCGGVSTGNRSTYINLPQTPARPETTW